MWSRKVLRRAYGRSGVVQTRSWLTYFYYFCPDRMLISFLSLFSLFQIPISLLCTLWSRQNRVKSLFDEASETWEEKQKGRKWKRQTCPGQLPKSKPAPRGVSPRSWPHPLQERNAGKVESDGAEGSSSTLREKTVIPEEEQQRELSDMEVKRCSNFDNTKGIINPFLNNMFSFIQWDYMKKEAPPLCVSILLYCSIYLFQGWTFWKVWVWVYVKLFSSD